jgi:hypothetical protein
MWSWRRFWEKNKTSIICKTTSKFFLVNKLVGFFLFLVVLGFELYHSSHIPNHFCFSYFLIGSFAFCSDWPQNVIFLCGLDYGYDYHTQLICKDGVLLFSPTGPNHDPADLCLLSSWDYRRKHQRPASRLYWALRFGDNILLTRFSSQPIRHWTLFRATGCFGLPVRTVAEAGMVCKEAEHRMRSSERPCPHPLPITLWAVTIMTVRILAASPASDRLSDHQQGCFGGGEKGNPRWWGFGFGRGGEGQSWPEVHLTLMVDAETRHMASHQGLPDEPGGSV